ncbi:gliding motility-associated C-terminal domain-containing protein [Chryseobacterium sp. Y16C]|uniref:T9SS type B sorting domain-containing protein n=1 Tax=Chryseobacterium sp. Y16C TaxID=2920939 RepID=UPI001F0A289C|nr:T9SS type B sorting domain-containing protein [Chryseobacterium sp. Y16C]UMQ40293.1 gliding motility-associated C-terminal domain-containing protein [Chryseobacterium sp. Y16C]
MKKLLLFSILFLYQIYYSQSDCVSAIPVCGNSNLSYDPSGPGNVSDIPNPAPADLCLKSGEHYSVWYSFTIATSGTLTFEITPNTNPNLPTTDPANQADYDWAVWGGGSGYTCGNLGTPVTCNYAGKTGTWPYPTGLSSNPPNAPNTGYNPPINVVAGETYVLLVDNYSHNSLGFSLTWGGTATLTSAFNDPTLTPHPFITPGIPNATDPTAPNEILKCVLPTTFDFSTLSAGIINGNPNFTVTYHYTGNDAITGQNPITTPIMVDAVSIYYYRIKYTDPANPTNPINGCFQTGKFKFRQGNITASNATVTACNYNNTGIGTFDLTSAAVYSGTATKKYYPTLANLNAGTNEITNPASYSSNEKKVYVKVITSDGCSATAEITLQFLPPLPVNNATVMTCNNNVTGSGIFDLTSANVYSGTNITKTYYTTLADLNAGTNAIPNPAAYTSTVPKTIFVKVMTDKGCTGNGQITLQFYPTVIVNPATIETCYIETNISTGSFNLKSANVNSQPGTTIKYYTTLANATAGTNEILNSSAYVSTNGEVYAKVFNSNNCYSIAKITLKVLPPVKSSVLADKTICIDDRTTLDAGPGFTSYEWSTGATTQSIQGVPVGEYWVKLQTGTCFTLQKVNVYSAEQPVITSLDIKNNTITVNVNGGTPPYKYSLDGIKWQDTNVFTGLPRGENKVYVKDSYNCDPIEVQVTVPNLLNAITPNGDNVNDYIDYSALAYKKNLVFIVYDRYGNKLYEAGKIRDYKWDGTASGKKILTGTYWYSISWNENDKNNTQTKYSGWVLVKNRE